MIFGFVTRGIPFCAAIYLLCSSMYTMCTLMAFICLLVYINWLSILETFVSNSFLSSTISCNFFFKPCNVSSSSSPLATDRDIPNPFYSAATVGSGNPPGPMYYGCPLSSIFSRVPSRVLVFSYSLETFPLNNLQLFEVPSFKTQRVSPDFYETKACSSSSLPRN